MAAHPQCGGAEINKLYYAAVSITGLGSLTGARFNDEFECFEGYTSGTSKAHFLEQMEQSYPLNPDVSSNKTRVAAPRVELINSA